MSIAPRKSIPGIKPYPAPSEGRYEAVRLDFNENTQGFPGLYPQDMPPAMVSAYPEYEALLQKLCSYYKVKPEQLLLTNGSDEGLLYCALTFVEPQVDVAVLSRPCFAVMPRCLALAGARIKDVPVLKDYSFDLSGIEAALDAGAKVAMFATPENPTGAVLPAATIQAWCKQFANTLFVIDEAYGEYGGDSVLAYVDSLPNLIVLKTFSKAWGMAGLRLGLMFGAAELLAPVRRIKLPYSVNGAAVWTALRLLEKADQVKADARQAMVAKQALEAELAARGYDMVRGQANSFLLNLGAEAQRFYQFARERSVLVRSIANPDLPETDWTSLHGYVRVSVGTPAENTRLLETLAEFKQAFAEKCAT